MSVLPVSTEPPSRRDRKKAATFSALRDAAVALVAERGFASVTVEDIAEAADVSTRTFFNYFPSKEAAIVQPDPELPGRLRATVLDTTSGLDPLDSVVAAVREAVHDDHASAEGRARMLLRHRAIRSDPHLLAAQVKEGAALERLIGEALSERLGPDGGGELYSRVIVAAVVGAARAAFMYWKSTEGTDELDELVEEAFAIVKRTLTPLKPASRAPARRTTMAKAGRTTTHGHAR